MRMFKQGIAVDETRQENDDAEYGKTAVKASCCQLAKQESTNGDIGQVSNFIGSPAALFRREHLLECVFI